MRPPRPVVARACLLALLTLALCLPLRLASADPLASALSDLGLVADPALDRATPRRALHTFLEEASAGRFTAAAHCLDLRGEPDPRGGPEVARELSYVLYRRATIDLSRVPDEAAPASGTVTVDSFWVGDHEVPLSLTRVRFEDGIFRWVISEKTVAHIPEIIATVRSSAWQERLPRVLRSPVVLGNAPWQWLGVLVSLIFAYAIGRAIARVAAAIGRVFTRRTATPIDDLLVSTSERPLRTICASALFAVFVYALEVSLALDRVLNHLAYTGFVVGLAWLILAGFNLLALLIAPDGPDPNLADTAGQRTRRALLQRIASAAVVGVTVALLLLQFDVVRHVGLSLLASAGIAGVVLGFAGQKSISGLIAGIQLSITQPVRLGDTIFIEGESGIVRDIFLTYAVVRFSDDRCLVVPLTRFLELPFQNWTLHTREVTSMVKLSVRFSAPVAAIRVKLRELCEGNDRWDKRRCELSVVDAAAGSMTLRMLMSTRSAHDSAELGNEVREAMIGYLQGLDGGKHLV